MKTKNLAVGAVVGLLVLALGYNFLIKPANAQAKKVKADTAAERTKLQPLEAQLAQANIDASHASTFKARLGALKNAVPDSPALANFIRDANGLAVASHVSWVAVTHGTPSTATPPVASIALGIQIKGTYEQVVDYLTRLSSLTRLVVVDSVTLAPAGSTGPGAAGATGGVNASTGPFTGGSTLAVTISARMFETPPVVPGTSGTGAATTPIGGTATPTNA